ncbi:MAG: hypothetical protein VB071_09050 [Lawsonibacter sp.]|nr:hypothetical protein [Lawsonibacter sp.]
MGSLIRAAVEELAVMLFHSVWLTASAVAEWAEKETRPLMSVRTERPEALWLAAEALDTTPLQLLQKIQHMAAVKAVIPGSQAQTEDRAPAVSHFSGEVTICITF